jgi:aspartate carbamoyltransferase catalytic subunit
MGEKRDQYDLPTYPGWEEFSSKSIGDKLEYFKANGRLFDILFSQQFDQTFLQNLFMLSDTIRRISRNEMGATYLSNILSTRRAMLYFVQPSTRTFLSFLNACHILGIKTSEIRDTTTSSELKGESPEDTVRTFSSYVDLIIMRHPLKGFVEKTAWLLNQTNRPVPVVNGGSGPDQHPTQALLDVYSMYRKFKKKDGLHDKTIMMVGDLKRGRTVRSLAYLMKNFEQIKLVFVSPPQLRMEQDILDFLERVGIPFEESDSITPFLPTVDAIYMTRIQDEHDNAEFQSSNLDLTNFHLQPEHLRVMKPESIILHPLPRRNEIHVDIDQDERAYYWRQERNGMWIRAALMAYLFGKDQKILEEGSQYFKHP